MPTKKPTVKKTAAKKEAMGDTAQNFKKVGDDLVAALKGVRKEYQKLDDTTKKKIIAGVAGTLALFAGIKAAKNISKKKK